MSFKENKILQYLFPSIFIVSVVLLVTDASMQNPVVPINYRLKKIIHSVLPEGWAFFTRDPQKEMKDIFEFKDQHFIQINSRIAEPVNLFGLSRRSAKINMEVSFIASQVPDSLWRMTNNEKDITTLSEPYAIYDTAPLKLIKPGIYLITIYKPVSWQFASHPENYKRQYKYIDVIIK